MQPLRHPRLLLATALGLGLSADLLFHGRAPGLSAPLFVAGLLLALASLARAEGHPTCPPNAWLGAAALALAAVVALRDGPLLATLGALGALGSLLLFVTLFGAPSLRVLDGWRVGVGALFAAYEAALLPVPLAIREVAELRPGRHGSALLVVGRGALLAAPVLLVFTGLLVLADSVFASYVVDLLSLRLPLDVWSLGWRALGAGLVAWVAAGGFLVALRPRGPGDLLAPPALPAEGETRRLEPALRLRFLGWGESVTVLLLVDLLFATFMLIQGAYLFGGRDTLARTGLTFAEYARRGFFELVTVACLSVGLLWALACLTRRETPRRARAFTGAAAALVLLVLGMLASAALRMWLYEQAFGFTTQRLLTSSFMVWLATVLVLLMAALLHDRPRLFTLGLPAAAGAYVLALALLNPDAMIVRENLDRYRATGDLDSGYLLTLSADAVPALLAALPELGPHRPVVEEQLRVRLDQLEADAARDGWPGWNLARARAIAALRALE
jgi:hypothetical protein